MYLGLNKSLPTGLYAAYYFAAACGESNDGTTEPVMSLDEAMEEMPSTNENGQSPDDEMLPGMMETPSEPMMEEDNLYGDAYGDAGGHHDR